MYVVPYATHCHSYMYVVPYVTHCHSYMYVVPYVTHYHSYMYVVPYATHWLWLLVDFTLHPASVSSCLMECWRRYQWRWLRCWTSLWRICLLRSSSSQLRAEDHSFTCNYAMQCMCTMLTSVVRHTSNFETARHTHTWLCYFIISSWLLPNQIPTHTAQW